LLSGSSPPNEYFQPLTLLSHVSLYGGGTLLIRELTVRWHLRWSQIFLALAYGVLEEGLCCKSFFDPTWKDLGGLANYANFGGVQWAWALLLITFHMTISTLIPLRIVQMLFPDLADKPLLRRTGMILAGLAVTTVVVFGFTCFPSPDKPFRLSPVLTAACLITIVFFGWLAFYLRNSSNPASRLNQSRIFNKTPILALSAFALMAVTTVTPYLMASPFVSFVPPALTVAVQTMILLLLSIFCLATICQQEIVVKRDRGFILGCLSYWIILSFFLGKWMPFVGIVTILLCILWCYLSSRANQPAILTGTPS